ncbi:MAG: NAD-dependent epimerase/dehydratase family protein [Candidatus Binatia bacterium]
MNILVTGIDGYIGSVLASCLAERGHRVAGLDSGFYRGGSFFDPHRAGPPACIDKDVRHVTETHLEGRDAVVHLAELSNDPLGQHNPALTYSINHKGGVALATLAKKAGVPRFVYSSSCSVYGAGAEEFKDEQSAVNPQTAYAQCKVLVERDVAALADDNFSPTFLRNATAYGPSSRMRFDLVLNNLAGMAWVTKEIKMTGDGTPWRPLVHVRDIAHAIACALEAPRRIVHNQVFNVGATNENYQIREIARIVSDKFPDCKLTLGKSDGDNRSYRVRFDKIHSLLPGFKCRDTAASGALELLEIFQRIDLTREMFESRAFTRLKQLEYLLRTDQIDDQLFWKNQSKPSAGHEEAGSLRPTSPV